MSNKFKVGETVRFNSGGPLMTVTDLTEREDGKTIVTCMWSITDDPDYSFAHMDFQDSWIHHEKEDVTEEDDCCNKPLRIR